MPEVEAEAEAEAEAEEGEEVKATRMLAHPLNLPSKL